VGRGGHRQEVGSRVLGTGLADRSQQLTGRDVGGSRPQGLLAGRAQQCDHGVVLGGQRVHEVAGDDLGRAAQLLEVVRRRTVQL
jgi:hypothetical protein